jgi:hypothetical protein
MTREQAIYMLKGMRSVYDFYTRDKFEALSMAIEALEQEQEPCNDCISRQAAIDSCLNGWNKGYKEIVEEIRALPPVAPTEKVGRWIKKEHEICFTCNRCCDEKECPYDSYIKLPQREDVFVIVRYALAEPKKETGSFEEQDFTFNFVAEKGLDNAIRDINNYILSKYHGKRG